MKKNITIYYLLFAFFCLNSLNAQTTFIPDHVFEQYLIDKNFDSDGKINGEVLTSDISGVTILDIKDYNIENFEGLQSFTSLEEFYLTSNLASTIPVINFSSNTQLTNIFILNAPGLSSVNVDNNIDLTSLQVVTLGSKFYDIDVDNNTKLTHLSLGNNALEFLNVKENVELKTFLLDGNPIGNIDISNNTKLNTLFCRDCTLLTAVNLNNGFESTTLESVLLTGNPELLCIKVGDIANAESETGWEKDATASYVSGFGDEPKTPDFTTTYSEDASVDGTASLDELFGVDSGSSAINKTIAAKSRRRWKRSRQAVSSDNDVVDFPNTGAGQFYYKFEYIVLNDCGKEYFYEVEVVIQDGGALIENIPISLCNNTEITEDFLNSNLTTQNYYGEWFAKWNGEWINNADINFGKSNFYKFASDHEADNGAPGSPDGDGSTITISHEPCSVKYSFSNAQNTKVGAKDFYEVDVLIESTGDFKLGSGELFFNYNREAFGENISSNGKLELTHPSNYVLGEEYEYPAYKGFAKNDDGGGFGIAYYQAKSYSLMHLNNITSTPKSLFHLKIEYLDVSKSPDLIFLEPAGSLDNRTNTACGPYTDFGLPNCTSFPGLQLTDITTENSGAVLSVGDEILSNSILVYPNPVSDNLIVNSDIFISKVEIYSVLGKKLKEVKSDLKSISLSNLSSGIYIMKIYSENSFAVKKIIKK